MRGRGGEGELTEIFAVVIMCRTLVKIAEGRSSRGMASMTTSRESDDACESWCDVESCLHDSKANRLEDFEVPKLFQEDCYELSEETRHIFPKNTFFIVGGARTGTNMHVDPNCTSAWNTLLCGNKRQEQRAIVYVADLACQLDLIPSDFRRRSFEEPWDREEFLQEQDGSSMHVST